MNTFLRVWTLFFCLVNSLLAVSLTELTFDRSEGFVAGEGFEAPEFSLSGNPLVTNTDWAVGDQSFLLPSGEVSGLRYQTTSSESVVFVDFYLAPRFVEEAFLPADVNPERSAVLAFVKSAEGVGRLFAVDHQAGVLSWVSSAQTFALQADDTSADWLRIVIKLDFRSSSYDVFVGDTLVLHSLGFVGERSSFQEFFLSNAGEANAFFDQLLIDSENPLFEDADRDSIPKSLEELYGLDDQNPQDRNYDDGDGIKLLDELALGLDPTKYSTDADLLSDRLELLFPLLNPLLDEGFFSVLDLIDGNYYWATGFEPDEGYLANQALHGQVGWVASPSVILTDNDEGSVEASTDTTVSAEKYFAPSNASKVWVSFDAKLSSGSLPDPEAVPSSAVFGFTGSKEVSFYDREQLKSVETRASAENWNRYYLELDYQNKRWNFIVNDQLLAKHAGFYQNETDLNSLLRWKASIDKKAGDTTSSYFDNFEVSTEIPAQVLSTDFDQDLLPTEWELAYGLDIFSADAQNDQDGDGLSAIHEYFLGSNPSQLDTNQDGFADGQSVPGVVQVERWNNLNRWTDPFLQQRFSDEKSFTDQLYWGAPYEQHNSPFGRRIRGVITAPETGEYVFWVTGQDRIKFFLSADETPFWKELISFTPIGTIYEGWDQWPGQSSVPIYLEAGQRYYFEVIQNENINNDEWGVAWQKPSSTVREVITAEYLSSYTGSTLDIDDDSLIDFWEKSVGLNAFDPFQNEGQLGNPDRDLWSNIEEQVLDQDPRAKNPLIALEVDQYFGENFNTLVESDWQCANVGRYTQAAPVGFFNENEIGIVSDGSSLAVLQSHLVDRFQYKYISVDQSFRIETKVDFEYIQDTYAYAGIWVTEEIGEKSKRVGWLISPDGRHTYTERTAAGGRTRSNAQQVPFKKDEYWLRLDYRQGQFYAYFSDDGENWFLYHQASYDLADNAYVGFAASSMSRKEFIAARFSNISLRYDDDDDGIFSDQEVALGTDPTTSDSDNDGITDYDEKNIWFTDPTVDEFDGDFQEVLTINGRDFTDTIGNWQIENGSVYARSIRGSISYDFALENAGTFILELFGSQQNPYHQNKEFTINFILNGHPYLGNMILSENEPLRLPLPNLASGTHQLEIVWVNGAPQSFLQIDQLRLLDIAGDWANTRIANMSMLDQSTLESYVSPLTIEGQSYTPSLVAIASSHDEDPTSEDDDPLAFPALYGNYYANVYLNDNEDTFITVTDQANAATFNKTLRWVAYNVLENSDSILLRTGDRLKITAKKPYHLANEVVSITTPSGEIIEQTVEETLLLQFDESGLHPIDVSYQNELGETVSETINIEVVAFTTPTSPVVMAGATRTWTVSPLAPDIYFETDTAINLFEEKRTNQSAQYRLSASKNDHVILARLANETQAIIGHIPVKVVKNYFSEQRPVWDIVEVFANGDQLWKAFISLEIPIPEDLEMKLEIFKSGTTFGDGTITRTVTAADFNEDGTYTYYLIRPEGTVGSTCHRVRFFQNGTYLNSQY